MFLVVFFFPFRVWLAFPRILFKYRETVLPSIDRVATKSLSAPNLIAPNLSSIRCTSTVYQETWVSKHARARNHTPQSLPEVDARKKKNT